MTDSLPAATRDPQGDRHRYDQEIASLVERWKGFDRKGLPREVYPTPLALANNRPPALIQELMLRHARGDSIEAIGAEVVRSVPVLGAAFAYADRSGPQLRQDYGGAPRLAGERRDSVAYAALALCTLKTADQLVEWASLVDARPARRAYLFDLLAKSFVPGYPMAGKYKPDRFRAAWTDPIVRALALPSDERAAALATHMKQWCRILRPWGWKPACDSLFFHFAYEVALAVCAYDIDDSTFAGHPYYPRDLVQWYRTHLRHTRDAWRPAGAGAGIPVEAPPLPAKADLAKSKRKAIARWLELAADGDADAVDSVVDTVGRPRKVEDIEELVGAMYENGQAMYADIKDDETLELTAGQLAEARGIGEFEGPPGPPFGPARCGAVLDALAAWVAPRGYTLFRFESDADAWCAVLVRSAYTDEFRALSDSLRIRIEPGSS